MFAIMKGFIEKYAILIIIVISVISRLPQLMSPYLILDGDEAILGLMAKHFLQGSEFPLFFYGQSYGFSFIEMSTISLFYLVFGVTELAVKLAMLSLWTLAIIFFYKAILLIANQKQIGVALLVTILLIFSPSFALWSMKARGGYLTAFLLANIFTYIIFDTRKRPNVFTHILLGVILVFVYQSQPLWLAGLLPIIVWHLVSRYWKKDIPSVGAGIGLATIFFYFSKQNLSHYWSPPVIAMENIKWETFVRIPTLVFQSLTGSYSYDVYFEPILANKLFVGTIMFGIILSTGYTAYLIFQTKKTNPWLFVLTFSVWGTIGYLILTFGLDPRYELPLTGFTFMVFYILVNELPFYKLSRGLIWALIGLGAISLYDYKNYHYENKLELIPLLEVLKEKEVTHVFCDGGLLQWQIIFYTNEQIIARYKPNTDRYPKYVDEVSEAYFIKKGNVAMVGQLKTTDNPIPKGFNALNKQYYFFENPTDSVLIQRGFNLTPRQP